MPVVNTIHIISPRTSAYEHKTISLIRLLLCKRKMANGTTTPKQIWMIGLLAKLNPKGKTVTDKTERYKNSKTLPSPRTNRMQTP